MSACSGVFLRGKTRWRKAEGAVCSVGKACTALGDGGSGCLNPGIRTRRVCAGEGKFVGTRGRESVNSVRRGVLQVQRATLSCVRFVRLHGPAAARGLVAGEAFSRFCGKEDGVPLKR